MKKDAAVSALLRGSEEEIVTTGRPFAWLLTDNDLQDLLNRIDRDFDAFAIDVANAPMPPVPPEYKIAFARQLGAWKQFRAAHPPSWIPPSSTVTFDEADRYAEKLIAWREKLQSYGVKISSPPPDKPEEKKDKEDDYLSLAKAALFVGGLAAVGYALSQARGISQGFAPTRAVVVSAPASRKKKR